MPLKSFVLLMGGGPCGDFFPSIRSSVHVYECMYVQRGIHIHIYLHCSLFNSLYISFNLDENVCH